MYGCEWPASVGGHFTVVITTLATITPTPMTRTPASNHSFPICHNMHRFAFGVVVVVVAASVLDVVVVVVVMVVVVVVAVVVVW